MSIKKIAVRISKSLTVFVSDESKIPVALKKYEKYKDEYTDIYDEEIKDGNDDDYYLMKNRDN